MNRLAYTATAKDEGYLLRDVIQKNMNVSKRLLKRCKNHPQGILVNGERQTVRYVVKEGDAVSLAMAPNEEESDIIHERWPIDIVYEDDMLMIVDKPPGVTMFPRRRGEKGSLAGAVLAYLEEKGEACNFHPVSRLDIGTSGLVLLAKNSYAADKLGQCPKVKCYECLAYGKISSERHLNGTIAEVPQRVRDATHAVFDVEPEGKSASTHVTPLYYNEDLRASACWVKIDTGRRHQIRVHLAHAGHPLLGDTAYGGPALMCNRPLLHAAALTYEHPTTGKKIHHFLPMHLYKNEPQELLDARLCVDLSLEER